MGKRRCLFLFIAYYVFVYAVNESTEDIEWHNHDENEFYCGEDIAYAQQDVFKKGFHKFINWFYKLEERTVGKIKEEEQKKLSEIIE